MTTVVAIVARCRVDSVHVLAKGSAMTGAQLCHYSSCLPWQCRFGCSNGQWSAFNGCSDRSLVDAADGRLVAGVAEWLFGEVLLMLGLCLPIRDRCRSGRSSGGLM